MILVDANILMYAAGAEHANKEPCIAFLEDVALGRVNATLDAEVLQEILHRYRAINRWEDGRQVYDNARCLFPSALPITTDIVDAARSLLDAQPGISARDALHAAVVLINDLAALCSYDSGFDAIASIRRVEPGQYE